jgi:hypothetical protein
MPDAGAHIEGMDLAAVQAELAGLPRTTYRGDHRGLESDTLHELPRVRLSRQRDPCTRFPGLVGPDAREI